MIKIELTKEMLKACSDRERKAEAEKWTNKDKSVTNHKGRRAGFLGEIAFCSLSGATSLDTFNHDVDLNKNTVEVKTKRSTFKPNVNIWEGTVPGYSNQQPDYFAFLNIEFAEQTGRGKNAQFFRPLAVWFGGLISYEDYLEKRFVVKQGEKYSTNGDTSHITQWNVYWRDLSINLLDKLKK